MNAVNTEDLGHEIISPRIKLGTALLVAAILIAGVAPLVLSFFD